MGEETEMNVGELMTREVITARPETPVVDVARLMLDNDVSGIPVIGEDGRLAGLVTEKDLVVRNANVHFPTFLQILDARIYLTNPRNFEEELRRALGTTARDIMLRDVRTVRVDDDLSTAATLMVDHNFNPIPVVDRSGQLVGIISRSDVIRHILEQETGDPDAPGSERVEPATDAENAG